MRRRILFLLLLCAGGALRAGEPLLDFVQDIENSQVTVRISGINDAQLWSHILQGFRARIQYTLQIYQDTGRPPLLGDRMLLEMDLVQEGRWDVFSSSWEIRHANGRRVFYADWEAFFRNFLELKFPLLVFSGEEKLYMLARVSFQQMVFRPPLNILQVFYADSQPQSAWRRFGVP
ncbi:MAG: hypothetical protein LBQ57_06565 [Spirochaetales bacterium]|nr:hypothetical protein [Spirochaetales bacterium]